VSEAVPVPVAAFQLECSSSVRAWSIWSYAWVTISAVVIVSPLRGEREAPSQRGSGQPRAFLGGRPD